jgi:hypothetical protein
MREEEEDEERGRTRVEEEEAYCRHGSSEAMSRLGERLKERLSSQRLFFNLFFLF